MFERCCDKCWHLMKASCPDLITCIQRGPLCHEDTACKKGTGERIERYRRVKVDVPTIFIGTATCGLGAGASKTLTEIKKWLEETKKTAEIVEVGCIGLCAYEPIVDVKLPGKTRVSLFYMTADKVRGALSSVFEGNVPTENLLGQFRDENSEAWKGVPFIDEHPFFKRQMRWVLENCGIINPDRISEYIARGGYASLSSVLKTKTPFEVADIVDASGLRGRGGGGFPTGKKWKFALKATGDKRYLICNADEGDPGAFMDRAVIEGDPHRLIEGIAIAAYAINADIAYIYIRAEYPLAIKRLEVALDQAHKLGVLGRNILDSGFSLDIKIKKGAGAFVCGEETALIHSIEGKRGMPRPRPPFPATNGLYGMPTVINNVETLANIPGIIKNGSEWFSAVGTERSKGTKVFALSGNVVRTGLVEVPMGVTVREIVFDIGGGIEGGREYKASQIGGPSGGCIPVQHLDTEVDYESLKQIGAIMGSGGLVVMDEKACMVDVAKFFMDFIQKESCGKCIPCREGTRLMLEILNAISRRKSQETTEETLTRFQGVIQLNRLAEVIKDTSLCGLGQTAPNPVLSTLRWFRSEYEAHVYERTCPAGVCVGLLNYRIFEEKCKGCGVCLKQCPSGAIMGAPKSPHYIIPDKCIGCGTCVEKCKFGAIITDEAMKDAEGARNVKN